MSPRLVDRLLSRVGLARKAAAPSGRRASIWNGASTERLYDDWDAWTLSPDFEVRWQFRLLRARARNLVKNNPWCAGFVDEVANNVTGADGIALQAQIRTLGGELAKPTNAAIEKAWATWGEPETASADGHDSWTELQRLIMQTVVIDGECFVRRLRGFKNAYGYALQIIDADLVDEFYNVAAGAGQNAIRMGVEVDSWNRPVAYHVWSRYLEDTPTANAPRDRVRIPAEEIIHLFARYRPNQTRGITWFAPVLTSVKHLDGYETSELVAARVAAAKMGFIINKSAEAIAAFDWDKKNGEQPKTMDVAPGLIPELLPGQEFLPFDPSKPSTAYASFTSTVLRAQARGLGMSYFTYTGDAAAANFSSMRLALEPERYRWRRLQIWLAMHLHRLVYRDWIDLATLKDAIAVDSRLGADLYDVKWKGRGWKYINPVDDLKAAKLEIDLGVNSRTNIAAEHGRDFEAIVDELAEEQEYAEEAGVDVSGNQITGVNPTTVSPQGAADETGAPTNQPDDHTETPTEEQPPAKRKGRRLAAL